jgi:ABC-type antimicrobial peptide transport system permease subunit
VGTQIAIRTATDSAAMTRELRGLLHSIDPDHAVAAIRTLDEIQKESVAPQRTVTMLLGLFALLTLAIMIAGGGGVAALSVAQRQGEIGLRMACGARPGTIVAMVLRQQLALVIFGILFGVGASLAMGKLISAFLYRTQPSDLLTLSGVSLLILAVGALACWMPARRAAGVDPMICLRTE